MQLQESGEMYLESLFVLSKKLKTVRAVDICNERGVSKPSVSKALGILKNGGYVTLKDDGSLALTASGSEIAEKIYERHQVLTKCLLKLGVDEETASFDACKIEHVISDKTFDALKNFSKDT